MADQFRCLFLLYSNPRKAASAILDHGQLLFAAIFAIIVSLAISTAAGVMQEREFSQIMQSQHGLLVQGPIGSPQYEDFLAAQQQASRFLSRRYIATGLKGVLVIAVVFVPFCILLLAAWDHLGGGLTILFRDYMPASAGLLFAWTAAHLPLAVLWWSPLMPSSALVVPFQVAGILFFLILAAPVLSTVTGATLGHSAVASVAGLAGGAIAGTFFAGSANLLYLFTSPWMLYYGYQMFGGDLKALGGGLANRQAFKRQLELATINPHDADAHYQLGLLYLQRRLPGEAEARFRRALEIDPNEPEALYQLGRLLGHKEGPWGEARDLLEKGAQLNPKLSSHEVWRELGHVSLLEGKTDEALRYLTHYTAVREYDPEGLVLFSRALRAAARHGEAKTALQQAIEAVRAAPKFRRPELAKWESIARQELRSLSHP